MIPDKCPAYFRSLVFRWRLLRPALERREERFMIRAVEKIICIYPSYTINCVYNLRYYLTQGHQVLHDYT